MDKLVLSLSPQQMDYIANALAQRPFAEVAQLMGEIARQLGQQQGSMAPPVIDKPARPNGQDTITTGA